MSNPFKKMKFGPTGKFPYGKVHETDEGELAIGIACDYQQNTLVINFGKPIIWIGLPPSRARELARMLIERADELDRRKI